MSSPFSELIQKSQRLDERKEDFRCRSTDVHFTEHADIVVPGQELLQGLFGQEVTVSPREFPLSDWALYQACQKLGPPPYRYMQECPPWLRAKNLNHWLEELNRLPERGSSGSGLPVYGKGLLVRNYADEVRAILSQDYVPLSNTDFLVMLEELLETAEYGVDGKSWLDADSMHIRTVFSQTPDGMYQNGVYFGNGETGKHQIRCMAWIKRTSCDNSFQFLQDGFIHRHIHATKAFLRGAIKEKAGQLFKLSVEHLEKLVAAETVEIPNISEVIQQVCKDHNLSEIVQKEILIGTEGHRSLFGLVNGISYAAHSLDNEDAKVDMAMLAGSLLVRPNREYLNANAQDDSE